MKKLYHLLYFLILSAAVSGQSGDGTDSDPYYGTISSEVTWNAEDYSDGIVYVGNTGRTRLHLTITSNGSLTINAGVTVIFNEAASNLIINGSGRLIVNGTSSNKVTMKKSASQANWGHIYFNAPTELSILEHCIIQDGLSEFGGGIYIYSASENVTLKNCLIYNCTSTAYGGGIEIESSNPLIVNCLIHNNSGAGIDILDGAPTITNCTIVNNNNTNTSEYGGIQLTNSSPTVKNCILWNNTQGSIPDRDYSGGGSISYSAATQVITGTGMVDLHSVNSEPTGPNFTDPSNSDYSILFLSPCRDAGTTPDPELPLDFLGNPRIGPYDIGAFEVQYSRWKTTASSLDWNTDANWDGGVPTSSRDIVIPAGASYYPAESPGPDYTIGSGKQMIIEPGAKASLNYLTNNGTIILNHNTTDFASLILNNYTRGNGGTEEIQLYLSGGGSELNEDYKWHYISSPVVSLSTDVFTEVTDNLAQYIESRPVFSLLQGWVAYDGYVYSPSSDGGPTFSALTPGKGYNYFNSTDNTYTFGGSFNTSDVTITLPYTTGTPQTMHGFNLLGNPFSAGLNWDDIIEGVYFPYPANTSKGLYFTRDNLQCSYIAGVGVPSDVTGIIPPMQGFFNKTFSAGNSIILPATSRTHENIHSRYKGSGTIPLVRLAILEDDVSNDETVVRFSEMAKTGLDNDYDALKMFLSEKKTTIHTSLEGVDYAINGQPFPESILEIPVVVNVTTARTHKIASTQLQGLDGYQLFLTDKSTGFTANLKTTPVLTFSAEPGLISNRFILKIDMSTGTEDIYASDNSFNIYQNFGNINIQTLADAWDGKTGSVKIVDMSGKIVTDLRNTGFSKTSVTEVLAPASGGLYFIEISSGMNRYVGKIMIK